MKYREIREEPKTKTKTKTKTRTKSPLDLNLQRATSQGELTKYEPKSKTAAKAKVDTKSVSKAKTATMQPTLDPTSSADIMRSFMNKTANITDPVDVDQTHGYDDPETTTTTLPAVISRDVALDQYNINWHDVKNLPGYAMQQIRGAFRPLFKNILGSELEEVTVATSIDPENSKKNMKRLIGYIAKHGKKLDDFNLEAFDIDPKQYKITKALVYNLGGTAFFIIEERMMGEKNYYIYAGPEKEDYEKITHRPDDNSQKRIA